MFRTFLTLCTAFSVLLLTSCGAERGLSGIWQQVACDPLDASIPCPSRVLELHLGRFGQGLTGIVVEYETESGRTTFDGSSECDCSFIKSGYAVEDNLRFSIDPQEASVSRACANLAAEAPDNGSSPALPCELQERRFNLTWDGEFLTGVVFCRGNEQVVSEVRFIEATGQTRTRCASGTPGGTEN